MINSSRCVICFRKHLISQHEVGEQRLIFMQEQKKKKPLITLQDWQHYNAMIHTNTAFSDLRIATLLFTKVVNINIVSITVLSGFSNKKKASSSSDLYIFFSQLHIRKGVIKIIGTHAVLAGSYLYSTYVNQYIKKCFVYNNCNVLLPIIQFKGATVFIIPL